MDTPDQHDELIAIVAAMEEEIAPLRARLEGTEEVADGPRRYQRGRLRGVPVVIAVTGSGKRNADIGMRRLVQRCQPTRILALGLGGALSPKLRVGELLVASEVMEGENTLAWPDLQWLDEAEHVVEHDMGRLVTVDEILSTPEAKSEWWGRTERDQPAAADMESACYARVALSYKIPYLVARAISDTAQEALPAYLEDCRAQDGSIDRRQVMWKAFWRPATWGIIFRLGRRIKTCSERLADFAEAAVTAARH